jgi:hypothetical protein
MVRLLSPIPDGHARPQPVRRPAVPYNVGRVADPVTCNWLCDTQVQLELAKRTEPRHIMVNLLVRVRYAVEIGGQGIALLRARLAPLSREHHGCNAFAPLLGEPFAFPGTINPEGVMRLVRAELRENPRFRRHLVRYARQQGC